MKGVRRAAAVRWTATTIAAAMILLWLSTARWRFQWCSGDAGLVELWWGRCDVMRSDGAGRVGEPGWTVYDNGTLRLGHWTTFRTRGLVDALQPAGARTIWITVPLWLPAALTTAAAAALWAGGPGRRVLRTRSGRCPDCGYDRAGLPAPAPCPECGAVPRAARSRLQRSTVS